MRPCSLPPSVQGHNPALPAVGTRRAWSLRGSTDSETPKLLHPSCSFQTPKKSERVLQGGLWRPASSFQLQAPISFPLLHLATPCLRHRPPPWRVGRSSQDPGVFRMEAQVRGWGREWGRLKREAGTGGAGDRKVTSPSCRVCVCPALLTAWLC